VDDRNLHVCRPEFWAVGISRPELSKGLRSRGNGDSFQSPMGVALVVVRHLLTQAITFTSFTESFRSRDRMVTFSVALLLFCFVVSNLWTQLIVALTSFPLFAVTLWCIWICWDFSGDGVTVSARLKFLLNVMESLRKVRIRTPFPVRPASLAPDDGSNRHSSRGAQGVVSGV
jgi:hypothetical protein